MHSRGHPIFLRTHMILVCVCVRACVRACACVCWCDTGAAEEEAEREAERRTAGGDEITGTQGGADDTLLPPGGWFPFVLIIISLLMAITLSKHLEKRGTPGGEYGVVAH